MKFITMRNGMQNKSVRMSGTSLSKLQKMGWLSLPTDPFFPRIF